MTEQELRNIYKYLGIIECYVMMNAKKDDCATNDYVFEAIENIQAMIDKIKV